MKLSQLKPNPSNPRTITKSQMEKLKNSIEKLPKMMELRPIIYDENFIILAGNMRFQALQGLGKKEIPDTWAKCAKDFSEEEKREFIVKDNLSMGEWNFEELANEYTPEELDEWGMVNMKFDDVEEVKAPSEKSTTECPECGHLF